MPAMSERGIEHCRNPAVAEEMRSRLSLGESVVIDVVVPTDDRHRWDVEFVSTANIDSTIEMLQLALGRLAGLRAIAESNTLRACRVLPCPPP